jgi:hypothetical protein
MMERLLAVDAGELISTRLVEVLIQQRETVRRRSQLVKIEPDLVERLHRRDPRHFFHGVVRAATDGGDAMLLDRSLAFGGGDIL